MCSVSLGRQSDVYAWSDKTDSARISNSTFHLREALTARKVGDSVRLSVVDELALRRPARSDVAKSLAHRLRVCEPRVLLDITSSVPGLYDKATKRVQSSDCLGELVADGLARLRALRKMK